MSRWTWSFRKQKNQDLDEEIQAHLAMAARDRVEQGEAPQSAALAVRREFGNVTLVKETTRDMWGWRAVEAMWQDLRYAFRSLRGSPAFAVVAVCSLALGIGANTAIFSFVDALLLKQLPVPEPSRLVMLAEHEHGKVVNTAFSYPFLAELDKRSGQDTFSGVFGRFPVRVNLTTGGIAEPLKGEVVTGSYFTTLRVRPALGRLMNEEDINAAVANPICVISYSAWQERFGGDPAIIGRKVLLNAHSYTVIGVTEKGFDGPSLQSRIDLQLPVSRMGDFMGGFFSSGPGEAMWKSAGFRWLEPLGRLRPGVTQAQAQTAVDPVARAIQAQLADPNEKPHAETRDLRLSDGSQGVLYDTEYSTPVKVLMVVVGLVLLIACANLAGLLLARASARTKECAVRLSLGASRWRLVRQLMAESVVIAFCGGAAGLLLAAWMIRTLLLYLNAGLGGGDGIHASIDPMVIGFAIALTLGTAILFGLLPAWQSTRPDVIPELKGAPTAGRIGLGSGGLKARKLLIVFQIALSLVILFTAGLLTRTLSGLKTIDLGFNPEHVLTLKVDPAMNGHRPEQAEQIFDEILSRLRAQPGIAYASLAVVSPLEGGMISLPVAVPGHVEKSSDLQTNFNMVSPSYFATLNQGVLAGREFTGHDVANSAKVAIVNQRFADQYMPGVNPIGRNLLMEGHETQIVGLVKNSRYQDLREQTWPLVYLPAKQTKNSGYTLFVRTRMDPKAAVPDVERIIRSIDPRLPIYGVRELREQIDHGMSAERVLSFLSSLFGALATLLCSMGIYGLIAYAVSRRTREIGVRIAIGARKSDVARLFLRDSALLVAAGIVVGAPLALVSTRVLKSVLYGVAPGDPMTLTLAITVFLLAGLLATMLPVLRAARIEPVQALRYE